MLGAIGVVYGDIGTSVLYSVKEVFGGGHVPFTPDNVHGILSLFFWTLTVIVSLKYVTLVLRADNHGEGGLVAMLALAAQTVKDQPRLRKWLLLVGIFGTCLFYGDGVITPAITVLGAVEGLEVISPHFKKYVVPITLVVLLLLFMVQKRGSASIGRYFGPVMVVWFVAISALGIYRMRAKLKRPYLLLNNIPVLVPDIVMGITLMSLFIFAGMKMGLTTIIIAHITFCIPYVILAVLPRFNRLPENIFEAALDLGATPRQAFWKVLFPEILPGVTSGALIAFTLSIDDFVISFFTAGNGVSNLSITIYSMAKAGINPKINALSTIMFGCIMILLILINIRSEKGIKHIQ